MEIEHQTYNVGSAWKVNRVVELSCDDYRKTDTYRLRFTVTTKKHHHLSYIVNAISSNANISNGFTQRASRSVSKSRLISKDTNAKETYVSQSNYPNHFAYYRLLYRCRPLKTHYLLLLHRQQRPRLSPKKETRKHCWHTPRNESAYFTSLLYSQRQHPWPGEKERLISMATKVLPKLPPLPLQHNCQHSKRFCLTAVKGNWEANLQCRKVNHMV